MFWSIEGCKHCMGDSDAAGWEPVTYRMMTTSGLGLWRHINGQTNIYPSFLSTLRWSHYVSFAGLELTETYYT